MTKKNKFGGKHHKKTKTVTQEKKSIVFKENGQEYAKVIKKLGNGFLSVTCYSGSNMINRRAHIRGTLRKRNWINPGDIVLINIREYQPDTCDIVLKYSEDEIRILRMRKMIWSLNTDGSNNYDIYCENEVDDDTEFDDINDNKNNNGKYIANNSDHDTSDSDDDSDDSHLSVDDDDEIGKIYRVKNDKQYEDSENDAADQELYNYFKM